MGDAQDILSLVDSIDYFYIREKSNYVLIGDGNQFDKIKKIYK